MNQTLCQFCNERYGDNVWRLGGQPIDSDPAGAFGEEFTHDEEVCIGVICEPCWQERFQATSR